jgi:hypothetical protein
MECAESPVCSEEVVRAIASPVQGGGTGITTYISDDVINTRESPGSRLRRQFAVWRYQGDKRDARLDLLRGFACFAMIADHIGGGRSSWLTAITGGNQFCVSAAEAFVFISGLVMGSVYARLIRKSGIAVAIKKALRRGASLYVLTVSMTMAFAAIGAVLHQWWAPEGISLGLVVGVATLHRTLFLVDIPLMYTFLIVAAVPALALLARGLWSVVLLVSLATWAVWQADPGALELPWRVQGNAVFHFPAWQILFFTALVAGFHLPELEKAFNRLHRPAAAGCLIILVAFGIGIYIAQLTALGSLHSNAILSRFFFDKADQPVGRLAAFVVLFASAYAFTTFAWAPIKRSLGWLLLPLGQSSLLAYSLHVFLLAGAVELTDKGASPFTSTALNTALQVICVFLVWGIIRVHPWLAGWIQRSVTEARRWAANLKGTFAHSAQPKLVLVP